MHARMSSLGSVVPAKLSIVRLLRRSGIVAFFRHRTMAIILHVKECVSIKVLYLDLVRASGGVRKRDGVGMHLACAARPDGIDRWIFRGILGAGRLSADLTAGRTGERRVNHPAEFREGR